jgi:hypothetical protein
MLRSITFGRKLTINNSVIMKNINVSLFAILLCAFLRFLEQGDGNVFVLALPVGRCSSGSVCIWSAGSVGIGSSGSVGRCSFGSVCLSFSRPLDL